MNHCIHSVIDVIDIMDVIDVRIIIIYTPIKIDCIDTGVAQNYLLTRQFICNKNLIHSERVKTMQHLDSIKASFNSYLLTLCILPPTLKKYIWVGN